MPTYNNKEYLKLVRPLPDYVQRDSYDIPVIEPTNLVISSINNGIFLINMKNTGSRDRHPERKIVHSFCYDDVLRRAYNNPVKYLSKIGPYLAASSFDFSMDEKMDFKQLLSAVYDNRWSGAFMQSHGITVIPTVGWVTPDTFDLCFSGIRDGGTFIISTLGVNNIISYPNFICGYKEMRQRFPTSKIICVGDRLDEMDDICYVSYKDSFGSWDFHQDIWQPKLYNWDESINFEKEEKLCLPVGL